MVLSKNKSTNLNTIYCFNDDQIFVRRLKMKKGYWSGQVKEIKNEEKGTKYVNKFLSIVAEEAEKNSGNFKFMGGGQPHTYVQKHHDLMFAALVEFNSLQDAIDAVDDPRYQDALAELGENKEDVVIRNLAIVEGT